MGFSGFNFNPETGFKSGERWAVPSSSYPEYHPKTVAFQFCGGTSQTTRSKTHVGGPARRKGLQKPTRYLLGHSKRNSDNLGRGEEATAGLLVGRIEKGSPQAGGLSLVR